MTPLYDTVLLADDDRASNELVRHALSEAGLHVVELDRPASLVSTMDRHVPAVVLLDPCAFEGSGWRLLRELRRDARYVPVPVIALMFDPTADARAMAFEQGAQQCAAKPIEAGEIVARVRGTIDHRQQIARLFTSETRAMRRIPARKGSRRVPLMVDDVWYFHATNKAVLARTATDTLLVDLTLSRLAESFGPDEFLRAHRAYLVHVPAVTGLRRGTQGWLATFGEGSEMAEVPIARRCVRQVRDALHL